MDDLSYVDIEKLAREAELIEPSDVWADLPPVYTQALSRFAARLLEKASKKRTAGPRDLPPCGTGAFWADQQFCFNKGFKEGQAALRAELRQMAAGLGE